MTTLNYSNTSVGEILSCYYRKPRNSSCLHQSGFIPKDKTGRLCHYHSLCYSDLSMVARTYNFHKAGEHQEVPRGSIPSSHGMQEHNLGDTCSQSLRITLHSKRAPQAATPGQREEQNKSQSNWRSGPPTCCCSDTAPQRAECMVQLGQLQNIK